MLIPCVASAGQTTFDPQKIIRDFVQTWQHESCT
jgi:hypothetical protein